jgi:hypothetical protein
VQAFLRIVAFCLIMAAPFLVLAFLSGQAEGLLWLMIPMAFIIPAYFLVFLVLLPMEWLLNISGVGSFKNVLVPIFGAIVASAITLAYHLVIGQSRVSSDGLSWATSEALMTIIVAFFVGLILGAAWRLSEILGRRLGWLK